MLFFFLYLVSREVQQNTKHFKEFSSTSLYPVVHGNGRFVAENEVIVDNYCFPKKARAPNVTRSYIWVATEPQMSTNPTVFALQTQFHLCHYAACHDEAQFKNPEEFIPERWLQVEAPSCHGNRATPGFYQHHPYSFIPFGVGVRACVGRRVAEMEMFFALSRVSGGCISRQKKERSVFQLY